MEEIQIVRKKNIYVVTLNNSLKGNVLNPKSISAHRSILEKLEVVKEKSAVIVTSSDPKSWCIGLDFDWIKSQTKEEFEKILKDIEEVLVRWSLLSLPTIACINGHCIAGGAILSSAMDFRIMRADKGWFAFTEIDVNIPLSPILYEIADLLPNKKALYELLLTGRRIGGIDAQKLGIVNEAIISEKLMPRAFEIAEELAQKDLESYKNMKYLIKQRLIQKKNKLLRQ